MQIVFVGPRFRNPITGGERIISEVLQYLDEAGEEVEALQGSPAGISDNLLSDSLRDFRKLTTMVNPNEIPTLLLEPYARRFSLVPFNWLVRATMTVKMVGLVNAFYFSYRKSALKNAIDDIASRLFFSSVDIVIAGGKAVAQELSAMGVPPQKMRIVYPALRPEFRSIDRRIETKRQPGLPTHILFVGRLHKIKGLACLLDAVHILRDQHAVRLIVVGDTSRDRVYAQALRDRLRRDGLEDSVEFTGRIEDVAQLIEIYRSADIFALPSLWETAPASLQEAMCFGLPIVASNVGGIPEYLGDGGILMPPGDSEALAEGIHTLIEDQDMREKLGQKSFERSNMFRSRTWGEVGREYHDILKEFCE